MDYTITVLTVSQTIPTGTGGVKPFMPWSANTHPITFEDPQLGSLTVIDDDADFHAGRYFSTETQQTVATEATFGTQTIPAGTQLSNFLGSVLRDQNGNEFVVMFPRSYVAGGNGNELGDRTSVLVFPLPKTDEQGNTVYPVFDLSQTYHFAREHQIGTTKYALAYTPKAVPCFTAGTVIETATGPRTIETLAPGDMILTRDHGFCALVWIGHRHLNRDDLAERPNLRPIRIRAGALAPGVPERDLTVSPQHRVLVRSIIARRMFDEDEILVAAKHLLALPGIAATCPDEGVTYWHMLFQGHEVVLSNGAWSESLFTGPQALASLDPAARHEIVTLFPELADPDFRLASARRLLTGREGRKLAERHARNAKQLVEVG